MAVIPSRSSRRGLAEWTSLATVVVLTLTLAAWLAGFIRQNAAYSFDSDEGIHAYDALRVSAYLRDGDIAGAMTSSTTNWFYPPVHPWLLGAALTLFAASHVSVRLFSLAFYMLDVLLMYTLGRWLAGDTRWPWLAGLTAALPMLAAPPMWIMGSLVYLEMVGVLFILLTFWGYWQGVMGRKWGWLAAGLGMVATGLTKQPYWLFILVPLPLALVIHSGTDRRTLLKRLILMVLPSVMAVLILLAWPMTRSGLTERFAQTRQVVEYAWPLLFAHLAFYVNSILIHFSPSPLIAVGLALAFVASLVCWRDDRLRPLAIFFVWHLLGISTHGGLAPRFLATAIPALWLMGGVWTARAAEAWPRWIAWLRTGNMRWAARLAMLAVIAVLMVTTALGLAQRTAIYPTLYMLSLETDPRAEDLYQWAATQIRPGAIHVGLVNDWDQMSGFALGWELTTRRTTTPRPADLVTVWEMHQLPEPTVENVAAVRDQMNVRGLNYLIAYTAPGVGVKRLQDTITVLGDKVRLLGVRDLPLRWYWPEKLEDRLYAGEFLYDEQLRQALEQGGTDRSQTVHVYAYTP